MFVEFSRHNPELFSFINGQIIKGNLPESVSLAFAQLVADLDALAKTRRTKMQSFDAAQMLWAGANGAATLAAAANNNADVNVNIASMMLEASLQYIYVD